MQSAVRYDGCLCCLQQSCSGHEGEASAAGREIQTRSTVPGRYFQQFTNRYHCSTPTCSSPTVADLSNSSSIPTPNDFSLLSHGSHMSEQSYLDASPMSLLSDHDVD